MPLKPLSHPIYAADVLAFALLCWVSFYITGHDSSDDFPQLLLSWKFGVLALFITLSFGAYRRIQAPYDWFRKPTIPRTSRGQKAAEFPPPFPNGWFMLCPDYDLARGEVRKFDVLGQNIVLIKTFAGEVGAMEAWCPHLGANLGVGGTINPKSDCLRCPFHGWEFDVNGRCKAVEGSDIIPTDSNLRRFPTRVQNQCILIWHDCEGREPSWDFDPHPAVNSRAWYLSGQTYGEVNAHIQEIPENGADAAHLNVLHKNFVWEKIAPSVTHRWSCTWEPDAEFKHRSSIRLGQAFHLFGVKIPGTQVDAEISQHGPGIVVLNLSTPLGRLVAYEFVTPIKTTTQMTQHVMFCSPTIPRFLGKFMLWALEEQFSRDIPIWEAKKFLPKPKISKADGPISSFRRWYSQFYSPTSMSFPDAVAKENMLDW